MYNEQIRDLLALAVKDKTKAPRPEIHVHPKMDVYITDMQDPVVTISRECFDLIEYGNNMKTIATTAMRPQSSRGYIIIKLHMELSTMMSPTAESLTAAPTRSAF